MGEENNQKYPFWLPKGTVRAALAGGLTTAVIYQVVTIQEVPQVLATLAGVAITWYFKTREGE